MKECFHDLPRKHAVTHGRRHPRTHAVRGTAIRLERLGIAERIRSVRMREHAITLRSLQFSPPPDEQWVIVGLAAVTVIAVLWLGIWKPISDWRDVEHNRYRNAQIALDWMHANEARARELAGAG